MGSFLQTISQIHHQQPSEFYHKIQRISQPIQKIKQYHGLFKSVCDSFLVTKQKYVQIFESSRNLQQIWDREKLNKVDALELFSGLIAFSCQSSFRQKLKFWFIMFDFNEIKNVSFVDLQYLSLCVCNASFKVLGKNARANESEIVEWLRRYFSQDQRINITKLYAFCVQSEEIRQFFQITTKQTSHSQTLKDFVQVQEKLGNRRLPLSHNIPYHRQRKKQLQQKLQWHRQFSRKLSTPYNPKTYLHSTKMSWVYGVRIQGIEKPFLLLQKQQNRQQQQLLYCSSTYMVLYNMKTNKQRYYSGHTRLISSFIYNKSRQIVISASESLCNRSIHIWSYSTLECIKILDTYKPVKSLSLLGKQQQMLIVVCGQSMNNNDLSQMSNKSTIMIFSQQQKLNYSLIFTYTYDQIIKEIVNIYTIIDEEQVLINIWNSFVVVYEDSSKVVYSQFQCKFSKDGVLECDRSQMKTLVYQFYDENSQVENKQLTKLKNNITCCVAIYLNEQNPSLRSFITNEQSLSLCIITGHQNGQLKCVYYNQNQFTSQDIIFQGLNHIQPKSSKKVTQQLITSAKQKQQQQLEDSPITCLTHTSSHLLFSHRSYIIVIPFSFLVNKDQALLRSVDIRQYPQLRLFNTNIHYFTLSQNQLLIVTQKQGDFVSISNRKILFTEQGFIEKQSLTRIKTLTKIQNHNNPAMCLLEKVQSQHLVYLTTQDRRILIMNSFTKEIENVWEINSPGDHITAVDAVYTDEDVLYFVCGCKQGKLYIKVDNEQNPRFYDCASEIIDVKISRDASYLLVATVQKYIYFFTQISKNFSSPRKLHFENQIPVCINFLDSNKMFTVNTSAKNVYMIQIPQLKHRNVQKENQRISISKMRILYPNVAVGCGKSLARSQSNVRKGGGNRINRERQLTYSKSYLGGELKYFLMSLNNGQLLFFQNRLQLPNLSYISLHAHYGEIADIKIVEGQQKFYTLGKYDNTLIQWQTQSPRTLSNVPQSIRVYSEKVSAIQIEEFEKMKEMSRYYKLINSSRPDDIYLFKGTKNEKLNQSLKKSLQEMDDLKEYAQEGQIEEGSQDRNAEYTLKPYMPKYKLNLRQPNISLEMSHIFGLECYKKSSVLFWQQVNQNQKILYHTTRFLLSLDLSRKNQQTVLQEQKYKISCIILTQNQQILYAVTQPNTKIRIHGQDNNLQTTHELGIIHLSTYRHYVLSYGILKNSYSINLHNYKTGQLLMKRTTELKIHQFIFINEHQVVSLNEIRIWKDLYPSQKIGKATAAILMPNQSDVCLATANGSLSLLNTKRGIFTVVNKAHESDITCITINRLEGNSFEILTVAKDDKIKVWNEKFNCKLMINLRVELLGNVRYLEETEDEKRNFLVGDQGRSSKDKTRQSSHHNFKSLNIRGIDSRKGKVLVYLATGQVYVGKFTLTTRQNHQNRSIEDNSSIRQSSEHSINDSNDQNESIFTSSNNNINRRQRRDHQSEWQKVIESHCSQTSTIFYKFTKFTVHPSQPVIASIGNDQKLLFRNYNTSQVIDTFYSQQQRISSLKFSRKGELLVLGFRNGDVKIYLVEVKQKEGEIRRIQLGYSQKFTLKKILNCQPINIQFSQNSLYFAVSFIGRIKIKGSLEDQQQERNEGSLNNVSFVQVFKQKIQQSLQINVREEAFYSLIDTIHIKEEDNSLLSSNKYIRCVHDMAFVKSSKESSMSGKDKQRQKKRMGVRQEQGQRNNYVGRESLQNKGSMCLIMYEQYLNQNNIRVTNSQRDKFSLYLIEEKCFMKKQFQQVDWLGVNFPGLVSVLQLNRFKSEILLLNLGKDAIKNNHQEGQQYHDIQTDDKKDQNPLSISAMCYYNNSTLIYGDTHGKLHLVRVSSLLKSSNQPLQQLKQHQMTISKTYPSQSSFISQVQLSSDLRFLFVAGQLDQSILKYNLQQLSTQSQLDYQPYDTYRNDYPEIYPTKEKFYTFINSLMPLREEIKNVLEDVENFDHKQKLSQNQNGLEILKLIGRRAFDRFNNICLHQQNLIYTLGPNLIIQSTTDTFAQKILPSDPHNLSYSPQISTIHMKPHSNILILATQEEAARLFVWDIRASICLSEMQVNCSSIYNIKLVGEKYAVFYGINSMYQLVLQVIDWKQKKVIALNNFLHSATWKIRDICVLQQQNQTVQENNINFITCGVQHLSEWSIKSNTLIQKHFTNIPFQSSFMVVNHFRCEYVLTGCEKGTIMLWKDRCLLQQVKVQTGPMRSLEVIYQSNRIISGGLDSFLCICRFQGEKIQLQNSKSLNLKLNEMNVSNIEESSRGEKESSRGEKEREKERQSNIAVSSTFLTEFDIQSIIYSPFSNTSPNYPLSQEYTFFSGTRSGDIYHCQYNLNHRQFTSIKQLVYGQDNQTIVCTAFSHNQQLLYTLTTSGKLQVWQLQSFQKKFIYKFMKKAIKLYIFKEYLLICFQRQIIFIQLDIRDYVIKIDQTRTLSIDGVISQCVLSLQQVYLAIGVHKSESNQIMIYQLQKRSLIYHSPSMKYEIEFMDFSTDEKYLLYKDKFQQIGMIYLLTLKRISTIFVEMKIQWQTEGLRISPKAQKIYSSYNCQNRITTIAKLTEDYILVGDQMGTLRVFPYPPESNCLGELHTHCYTQHMNKVNTIKQYKNYIATTAVYDRSLIIWRKYGFT